MSDEFIEVATLEINEDLSEIGKILTSCQTDLDILSNAAKFQKHTHKIKGLAPMMGKESLGSFTALWDSIFKKMSDGVSINGVFDIFTDSYLIMTQSMTLQTTEFEEIRLKVSKILDSLN